MVNDQSNLSTVLLTFVLLRVGETTLRSTRVSANEDDYVHLSMDPLSLTNAPTGSSAPRPTKSVKQTIVETRELDYISMDDILRVCSMCHSSCRRCVRQGMLCSHIRSVFANCYARAHGQSVGPFTRVITRAEQSGEETDSSAAECIGAIPPPPGLLFAMQSNGYREDGKKEK